MQVKWIRLEFHTTKEKGKSLDPRLPCSEISKASRQQGSSCISQKDENNSRSLTNVSISLPVLWQGQGKYLYGSIFMLRHHCGCCWACCDLPAVKAMQETQRPEEGKIIYPLEATEICGGFLYRWWDYSWQGTFFSIKQSLADLLRAEWHQLCSSTLEHFLGNY